MAKFGLSDEQYQWIKRVLDTFLPDAKVFVFGSRARGDHKRYSDLDLAVEPTSTVDRRIWSQIEEQFSNSSLPIKIDLIEVGKIDPSFRKSVEAERVPF